MIFLLGQNLLMPFGAWAATLREGCRISSRVPILSSLEGEMVGGGCCWTRWGKRASQGGTSRGRVRKSTAQAMQGWVDWRRERPCSAKVGRAEGQAVYPPACRPVLLLTCLGNFLCLDPRVVSTKRDEVLNPLGRLGSVSHPPGRETEAQGEAVMSLLSR